MNKILGKIKDEKKDIYNYLMQNRIYILICLLSLCLIGVMLIVIKPDSINSILKYIVFGICASVAIMSISSFINKNAFEVATEVSGLVFVGTAFLLWYLLERRNMFGIMETSFLITGSVILTLGTNILYSEVKNKKEKEDKELKQKAIYQELKYEADRQEHERNEEYRINFVHRHKEEILNKKEEIEKNHKFFFYENPELLDFCKKQIHGSVVIEHKNENYERLKISMQLDILVKPDKDSMQEKIHKAIEKIYIEESTGLARLSLRKEFIEKHEKAKDFAQTLSEIEETYDTIRKNSQERMKDGDKDE
jgi:hypothetical protein